MEKSLAYYIVYFDEMNISGVSYHIKGINSTFDDMCAFGEDEAADCCDALKHYPGLYNQCILRRNY